MNETTARRAVIGRRSLGKIRSAVEKQDFSRQIVSALVRGWRRHDLSRANYFLRTPASVFPRLCVAAFAAGVSTALPCDAGPELAPLVCGAPRLLPVVPLPRAFAVLGPGDPPVPLIVLPFESVDPDPTLPVGDARAKAREILGEFPAGGYMTIVEHWRQLPDGQIQFTMRRLPTAD